jgi:hypothetical protein
LGVPVRIKDDASVGRHEIDAEAAGTGGQEEAKVGRIGGVKVLDSLTSEGCGNSAVESLER